MTLKDRTFAAVRWTTAAAAARILLQLAQLALLSRLLLPSDFGLMAVVGVALTFAGLFADLGLNSAYVQRRDITPDQRTSLFWLNIAVSLCVALLLVAVSPLLAHFFGDPRLTALLALSALALVFGAAGQQLRMSAEKELQFRPVVVLELAAALLGFTAAVVTASAGWGVYALVAGALASSLSGAVLAWLFLARGWRPTWRLRMHDVRPFWAYGSARVANDLVNQLNSAIDLIIGGRWLSATELGLYSVPRELALQIQFVINPIVTRVGFPLIAQVQEDVARVRSIYLNTLNMTASTNAPLYLGAAFFAPDIVALMLGAGWERSADLLQMLAIWGGLRSIGNPVGSLLFGMGRAALALKWNLGMSLLVIPALWLGAQRGADGMVWALLLLQAVLFVPGWLVLVRPLCHAGLFPYAVAALRPFLLSLAAVAPAYCVAQQIESSLGRLGAGVAIAAPFYLVFSYWFNKDWWSSMMELLGRRAQRG